METHVYAYLAGDQVIEWPVTKSQILNRGLPLGRFARVNTSPQPEFDTLTQRVVEVAPEADGNGYVLQQWGVVDLGADEIRETLLAALADLRWRRETGGLDLPDGTHVRTDDKTQARLTSAQVQFQNNVITEVRWKLEAGFVTLSGPEITAIAGAVTAHVAACFAAEETVAAQIAAAATVEDLRAIDIQAAFDAAMA